MIVKFKKKKLLFISGRIWLARDQTLHIRRGFNQKCQSEEGGGLIKKCKV
jgi:hypothetical protein